MHIFKLFLIIKSVMKRMSWRRTSVILALCIFLFPVFIHIASGHVPYLEHRDFSSRRPFEVRNSIEQSLAIYAWLKNDGIFPCHDIDVYTFDVTDPVRVYIEVIVPVCPAYETFVPWFALVGPNLPDSPSGLPFAIPPGYGAVVKENVAPGESRETFYEPFGGKWYYNGPVFDELIDQPGSYSIYYWDPHGQGGDYVAVLGRTEQFGFWDIIRALIYTPMIRKNHELHTECDTDIILSRINRPNPGFDTHLYRVITQDIVLVGSV